MLRYTMDVEEYVRASGSGLELEELSLFGLNYKFADISGIDIDHFPEEEQMEELCKNNSSVFSWNFDRLTLSRYVAYMEAMVGGSEKEYTGLENGENRGYGLMQSEHRTAIAGYITASEEEDHLRTIYHISEEAGEVSPHNVATHLHSPEDNAEEAIENLQDKGLLQKDNGNGIKLTKEGFITARRITNKHRIIEVFLEKMLRLQGNRIHEEAHRLEHMLTDDFVEGMSRLLNRPKRCPHGKAIK